MKSAREIFSDNLQALIESRKVDQKDLAEYVGVSEMAVSNWVRGEKYPRIDRIQKIADFFNVPKSRLTEEQKPNNILKIEPKFVRIPILGKIACGEPIFAEENIDGYVYELEEGLPSGKLFGLIAKGDSMEPNITNGSKVLIRAQSDVEHGEIAAVLVNDDTEATLKRVKKQGNAILLMSDNPNYEPIVITSKDSIRIIGKAVRVTKDLC